VSCFRRAQQNKKLSREDRQQTARKVTCRYDDEGSLIIKASLPAETGDAAPEGPRCSGRRGGRVALGDCSPRAPTDPDLQISRIRLF